MTDPEEKQPNGLELSTLQTNEELYKAGTSVLEASTLTNTMESKQTRSSGLAAMPKEITEDIRQARARKVGMMMHVAPGIADQLRAMMKESGASLGQLVSALLHYAADTDAQTRLVQVYNEQQEKQLAMLINRCRDLTVAVSRACNRRLSDKAVPSDTRSQIIADADAQTRQIYAQMDELRAIIGKLKT